MFSVYSIVYLCVFLPLSGISGLGYYLSSSLHSFTHHVQERNENGLDGMVERNSVIGKWMDRLGRGCLGNWKWWKVTIFQMFMVLMGSICLFFKLRLFVLYVCMSHWNCLLGLYYSFWIRAESITWKDRIGSIVIVLCSAFLILVNPKYDEVYHTNQSLWNTMQGIPVLMIGSILFVGFLSLILHAKYSNVLISTIVPSFLEGLSILFLKMVAELFSTTVLKENQIFGLVFWGAFFMAIICYLIYYYSFQQTLSVYQYPVSIVMYTSLRSFILLVCGVLIFDDWNRNSIVVQASSFFVWIVMNIALYMLLVHHSDESSFHPIIGKHDYYQLNMKFDLDFDTTSEDNTHQEELGFHSEQEFTLNDEDSPLEEETSLVLDTSDVD